MKEYNTESADQTYLIAKESIERGSVYVIDGMFFMVDMNTKTTPIVNGLIECVNYWGKYRLYYRVINILETINDMVWLVELEEIDKRIYRNELLNSLLDEL